MPGLPAPAGTLASPHEQLLKLFRPLEAESGRHQAAALMHGDETRRTIVGTHATWTGFPRIVRTAKVELCSR